MWTRTNLNCLPALKDGLSGLSERVSEWVPPSPLGPDSLFLFPSFSLPFPLSFFTVTSIPAAVGFAFFLLHLLTHCACKCVQTTLSTFRWQWGKVKRKSSWLARQLFFTHFLTTIFFICLSGEIYYRQWQLQQYQFYQTKGSSLEKRLDMDFLADNLSHCRHRPPTWPSVGLSFFRTKKCTTLHSLQ